MYIFKQEKTWPICATQPVINLLRAREEVISIDWLRTRLYKSYIRCLCNPNQVPVDIYGR